VGTCPFNYNGWLLHLNVDIEIPKDKLIVMTGLSGSGKSSLAFDTIYAEVLNRKALS
jgi:excinuclease UvrABC ATPase subunit